MNKGPVIIKPTDKKILLEKEAIEVIQILTEKYKVRITFRYKKAIGTNTGLWIVDTMGKSFRHENFPKAVGEMTKFVYNAHENKKI